MNKIRLAILASGNGSNAEAIMKWAHESNLAEVVCLGSDKREAYALERAKKFGVPGFFLLKKRNEDRVGHEQRLFLKLDTFKPDWIILAGYMKILSPSFLENYPKKIINIHPSLLPQFPGLDGYGQAYTRGVEHSGCSVHYVDEGMDTGEIIAQATFPRLSGDTLEDFKKRGLELENEFYPRVIENLLLGHKEEKR